MLVTFGKILSPNHAMNHVFPLCRLSRRPVCLPQARCWPVSRTPHTHYPHTAGISTWNTPRTGVGVPAVSRVRQLSWIPRFTRKSHDQFDSPPDSEEEAARVTLLEKSMRSRQPTDLKLRCMFRSTSHSRLGRLTDGVLRLSQVPSSTQRVNTFTHLMHLSCALPRARRKRTDHLRAVQKIGSLHRAPFERKSCHVAVSYPALHLRDSRVICARLIRGSRTLCRPFLCERKPFLFVPLRRTLVIIRANHSQVNVLHIRALVKADTVVLFDTYGSADSRLHSAFLYLLEVCRILV